MSVPIAVCRKCKRHARLVKLLEKRTTASLQLVGCQKICHGPVVGVVVAGRPEWFERVDGTKAVAALVRLTEEKRPERIPKPLRRRRVASHAGRPPRR